METSTKQDFEKKLQRKVIVGRDLAFIILGGIGLEALSFLLDDLQGSLVGILLGLSFDDYSV